jgi:hypothetical protein
MGADMVLASLGFKADEQFKLDTEQANLALARARHAIETLDETKFDAINEELSGEYEDIAQCKQLLLSDVAAVEAALASDRRDSAMIPGGAGIVLLVSGGPTWGDPPTELSESIWRLADAHVMPDSRWPAASRSDETPR